VASAEHPSQDTATPAPAAGDQDDSLDEALDESFPASDPVPGPAIVLPSTVTARR
jgi:hypothetical protein